MVFTYPLVACCIVGSARALRSNETFFENQVVREPASR